jgi:uncharacterized protein (TIGR02722 family)
MKRILLLTGAALAVTAFTGCGTTTATYTSPTDSKTAIVSLNKVNVQDWDAAAGQMIESLLSSGVLDRAPKQPAVLAIDRVVNKTSDANLDTTQLTKNIRVALNRTGKVATTTTYGVGAESQMAADVQTKRDFMSDDRPADRSPDYTLTGRIIEDVARAGNVRQITFSFQLSLTDTRSGLAVWEDQRQIQKTGTRSSVGW